VTEKTWPLKETFEESTTALREDALAADGDALAGVPAEDFFFAFGAREVVFGFGIGLRYHSASGLRRTASKSVSPIARTRDACV
jgi:hypothetical protein